MEAIIFLYVFFTGLIYASWLYDTKDAVMAKTAIRIHFLQKNQKNSNSSDVKNDFLLKFLTICCALANGWYMAPILIGRAIKQIYKC